ncbi:MAG: NHL repeat-containing protein [Chloroflexota bacterium]
MSLDHATEIPQTEIAATESNAERGDYIIPSLFLSAAAIILAFIDPIHIRFEPHLLETAIATALGLAVLWVGTIMLRPAVLYTGVALLLVTIAVEAITQPTQLSVPLVAIWPLRILLVLLVGFSWAFLMRPPRWFSRALVAVIVPTILVLALWGGPATGAALFGWNVFIPVTNFTPYWLAIDSNDTLYATDASGDLIWVFDSSGVPQGTIRTNHTPAVGTPGPGILPTGLAEEMNLKNVSLNAASPVTTGTLAFVFDFCGIAVDSSRNLYTVDSIDPTGPKILRFDHEGMINQRLPVPTGYGPTKGCLAVDDDHIFLASRYGKVYVMSHAGKVQQEVTLAYQPLGLATNGTGELLITGPNMLNKIELSTGTVLTTTLPAPPGQLQIPYQALVVEKSGDILVSDWGSNQVLRVDAKTNKITGAIGSQGFWPGQFKAMGGMALDSQGRLYVADWQHRVIQRFGKDGTVDSLYWAARAVPETQSGEVEKD